MIYLYLIFILFGNICWSLRCKHAWPPNCLFNSTCLYNTSQCHSSSMSNVRGGVYCTTIIRYSDEIVIGTMDCLYDQETTKTCFNQSKCLMKHTSQDKSYLHCCCDKDLCNFDFILSNASDDDIGQKIATDFDDKNRCQHKFCSSISIIILISIVLFILLFFLILCFLKDKKSFRNRFRILNVCSKDSNKDVSIGNVEKHPFLSQSETNEKKLDVNHLVIEQILKRGTFSAIHQGKYSQKQVAIKIYDNYLNNERSQILFEREKDIYQLSSMQHHNILKYFGYCSMNGKGYIVTELCRCGSLGEVLRSRMLKDKFELLSICQQIANGLEYLHRDFSNGKGRGPIAHRDLKPENILFSNETHLVICDFGMSIQLDPHQTCANEQQQAGTARYMSPELLAGTIGCEGTALLKCDVYALAITFWQILSRYKLTDENIEHELPFEKQLRENRLNLSPSIGEMLQVVNLESPFNRPFIKSSWRQINDDLIQEIIRTIEQCWDQNPDIRINSALVAQRLQRF